MRVIQINSTCGIGSTGKICVGVSEQLTKENHPNCILFTGKTSGYPLGISCAESNRLRTQALKAKILGNYGFNSKQATKKMIAELKRSEPDIVHIHNIHSHDCHLEMLFSFLRRQKIKIVWTFHDCWAFTGYCSHFTMAGCDKWESRCCDCPQRREYSWLFDRSGELFDRKKKLFEGLDLTIVTPSLWLADKVKRSFLQDHPIEVINNGIDLDVFKPIQSDFRSKYGAEDKKLILGVSFGWGRKKGLDVFVDLARRLSEDYQIVLVGADEAVDKTLPDNILSIRRTQNQQELAAIYSSADVFVNPSREENYPTVNMEALACGTPVITFRTGGSPEMIDDDCGSVVECDDVNALEKEIRRVCEKRPFSRKKCVDKAQGFDKNKRFREYVRLYERIIPSGNEGDRI